jgi:hypothetical protein
MNDFNFMPGGIVHADGNVSIGDDARLNVTFYTRSLQNNFLSQQTGRPVFEPHDFVRILQPGERDTLDREVNDLDKMRWPRHWAAYQEKREQTPEGTPLAVLFPHEPHIVDMMSDKKIFTAEQLAGLTEPGIQRLGMGGRQHVERAKRLLDASQSVAGAHKMQAEIDGLRDQVGVLQTDLKAAIDALHAARAEAAAPRRRKNAEQPTTEEEPTP